jgi:Mpv17 / PMP22 family
MIAAEACIWTPVQFLNFRLLPVQHQQMFVNFMSIVEAAVLSWCALACFWASSARLCWLDAHSSPRKGSAASSVREHLGVMPLPCQAGILMCNAVSQRSKVRRALQAI